jgi:hypothetical protein
MTRELDVLVVGSGPAGASYARLIAERRPQTSIAILDLGPALTDPPGRNVNNLVTTERERAQLASQGPDRGRLQTLEGFFADGTRSTHPGLHLARAGGLPAAAMASCVGGMGALWSCVTPRPIVSERIPFIGDSEWDAAITTAEAILGVDHQIYEPARSKAIRAIMSDLFGTLLPPGRTVATLPQAVQLNADGTVRWTGVDSILEPISNGP